MAPDSNTLFNDSPTQDQPVNPDLRPRPSRKPKRPSDELGLGTDKDLADLAEAFIKLRREHFPALAKKKLDEAPSQAVIEKMVVDLKERHGTGIVTDVDQAIAEAGLNVAACYLRFSDDNSQKRSIIDQLRKVMQRAASDRVVPLWSLLFVDYARSAVYDYRYGFEGLLKRLQSEAKACKCVLIDEFARGSREDRDSWRLAGACKRMGLNLIGASDGFSLDDPNWDMQVSMFNMINRMDKKFKSMRVRRGMEGAAADQQILGRPPFGFTRAVKRDNAGNIVTGNKGEPAHVWAHDPEASVWARQIFEMAIIQKLKPHKIAQELNKQKIDDCDHWEPSGVINILVNPAYIGMIIWGRTTKVYNHETQKYEVVTRPWKEWVVSYDKSLALIPKSWHVQMRKEYEKSRPGRPAAKRLPDRVAVTLFSKALKCGYCGGDIKLVRSNTKSDYRSLYCPNGSKCARGCKLKASKSVRIIEKCLLSYIHTHLLTEDAMLDLVERANAYLVEEAKKPKASVAAEKSQLRKLEKKQKKYFERIDATDDPYLLDAYDGEVAKLQRQISDLRKIINEKETANAPVPLPLDPEQLATYLTDLRGLLNQEVPAAAEAIAELTGPIMITQEAIPGMKTKAKWIATFSPDFLGLLTQLGASHNYPDRVTLEFLSRANWTIPSEVAVEVREAPAYERMGSKFKELRDNGASVVGIAAAHGTTEVAVRQAIHFAETGERPTFKSGRRTGKQKDKPAKYIVIAHDVSRLKAQRMSFPKIQAWLLEHRGIHASEGTVRRAWDYANPDAVKQAVEQLTVPIERTSYRHLSCERFDRIKMMLADGHSVQGIAQSTGCSESTVYRIRRTLA